jgi:hypothetical protein
MFLQLLDKSYEAQVAASHGAKPVIELVPQAIANILELYRAPCKANGGAEDWL